MDQDDGREQDDGNGHQPEQVAPQVPVRKRGAACERERFFDDEQVQKQREVAEDLLAGDGVVVMQVKKEQGRQEQQPEQSQWMERFPGTRQQPDVTEGGGQDQEPGKHRDEFQPRECGRNQPPDLTRQPTPDETLGIIDQPVGISPIIQAGPEGVRVEPIEQFANPGGRENKQQ